ncbi:hypothetical protein ISR92_03640 [Patescibacteria group bacterium]|nr:hypothetical protein [Patescibacteria group bacterium]
MRIITKSLRIWFIVHFVVDFLIAIPLFIAPIKILTIFGFTDINSLLARLVAAALFGIGGASLLINKGNADSYNALLSVKVIWSFMAIVALLISLLESLNIFVIFILIIFVIFSITWIYYKLRLSK